jgi:hypothetical protein
LKGGFIRTSRSPFVRLRFISRQGLRPALD